MSSPHRVAVVGGGVAGVLCAALRARSGCNVVLIEGAPQLGGLLGSWKNEHSSWFDYGTHVPRETGIEEVDALLFESMDDSQWNIFTGHRSGNYFEGALNARSPYPDVRRKGEKLHERVLLELQTRELGDNDPATAEEAIVSRFGPTLAHDVFGPIIAKCLGRDLGLLAPSVIDPFVSRVLVGDPETARDLKSQSQLDDVVGFHDFAEGQSELHSYYPRRGGVVRWIDDLVDRHLEDVVDIRCGTRVEAIDQGGGRVVKLHVTGSESLEVDEVIWTGPLGPLVNALQDPACPSLASPDLVPMELHHFEFDRPFATDLHYLMVLDVQLASFRVTLYPELRGDSLAPPFNCTVEILGQQAGSEKARLDRSVAELRQMGVLDTRAHLNWTHALPVPGGFPRSSPATLESQRAVATWVEAALSNVHVVGRSAGRVFLMQDVLASCFEVLSD